jgi:O-methyltransferase involved in polyketide biosynthesis
MSVGQRFEVRVPDGFDVTRPNVARICDYLLSGKDNFAADRAIAEELQSAGLEPRQVALANRSFLRRAVRTAAASGVSQFLDLGCGFPTWPSVDEVAREMVSGACVSYVDHDPVVVAHNDAVLGTGDGVGAIRADVRDPESVVQAVTLSGCIDFGRPVAVLLTAVLHFISDDENPEAIIVRLRRRLAPGSYLVLAAYTSDGADPDLLAAAESAYKATLTPFTARTLERFTAFFDGFEILEPGIVCPTRWRPSACTDRTPLQTPYLCGMGQLRK